MPESTDISTRPLSTDGHFQVHRMRTEYNIIEDRLRLICADTQGEVIAFWLTQRLLQRLVPTLIQLLKSPAADNADIESRIAMQKFAQQAAVAGKQETEPVKMQADTPCHLIEQIHLTTTRQSVSLKFEGAEGRALASLPLNGAVLRQWLHTLCEGYRVASWPMTVWPEWLQSATQKSDLKATSKILH